MNNLKIAPSLLAADFSALDRQVALVEEGGADWLHLDVMDGHFVPNITFGPPLISSIRKRTQLPFDVHLMIENADKYLEAFRDAGAEWITVHVEACPHLNRTIHRIRELGAHPGVCINPATPVSLLSEIIRDVDLVLIMSVNPGFGGQKFIGSAVSKLKATSDMIQNTGRQILLEVDGGIDTTNAASVVGAGANVLVAGSSIFGEHDVPAAIRSLRKNAMSAQFKSA